MVDESREGASAEGRLREAIEDFFFGFRAFTALPDQMLAARRLGRTHHRILYFTRRDGSLGMGELLTVLGISKQAAHGPVKELERQGLLVSRPDPDDGRMRRLEVTQAGAALEAELSAVQMQLLDEVFAEAGPGAQDAWLAVMAALRRRLETPGP